MRQWFLHPGSVGLIVVVAIAARLAAGAWFESRLPPGEQFEFGDSDGYWVLGQQIAAGKPYEYRSPDARVFRMPGYPVILAPIFLVFGPNASPVWGRALSAVLGGATTALMVWWGTQLFDLRTGVIAGWITAFYPGAVAMGSFILSEAPFLPLMVAHLALATAAFKATTTRNGVLLSIAAGLAAAGAIYMRPSWLLFIPFACLFGLLRNGERWRIVAQNAIAMVCIGLCLSPWWIRNYRETNYFGEGGHFVLTTLQVGASLYDGLNPRADGSSNMWWGEVKPDPETITITRPEYDADMMLRGSATTWAVRNPLRVIQLVGIKFSRMWNVIPNEAMFRSWVIKLVVAITFTPLFVLGCYGVIKYARLGWPYLLAGLPALYFTLLHVIFVASIRYREPAMLGLIVLASGVIAQWIWTEEAATKQNSLTTGGKPAARRMGEIS